ncbi:MAG: glycosyltransferase family 39 protein [Planctomycetota bacterium]
MSTHPPQMVQCKTAADVAAARPSSRWIWAVGGLALAIRLAGTHYGLPFKLVDDEWIEVRRAMLLGAGVEQTEPFRLVKALLYYILFAEYGLFYVAGRLTGAFQSAEDLGVLYLADPAPLYLLGRVTSALMGTATVLLTLGLGARLFGGRAGRLAALGLAVAPLHAELSHFIRVDVLLTLLCTWGVLAALRLQETPSTRRALLAGTILALATLAKLPGLLLAVPIGLALVVSGGGSRRRRMRAAGLLALLAAGLYVALNRHVITEAPRLWGFLCQVLDTPEEAANRFTRQNPDRIASSLAFYTAELFPAYGPLPLVTALVGLAAALRRQARTTLVPLSLAGAFALAMLLPQTLVNKTYLMPLEPILWIFAALPLATLASRHPTVARLLTAAVLAWPASATLLLEVRLLGKDTRIEAGEWIADHFPAGTRVYLDSLIGGPALEDDPANRVERFAGPRTDGLEARRDLHARLMQRLTVKRSYRLAYHEGFIARGLTLDEVLATQPELIAVHSGFRDAVLGERGRKRFPRTAAFYEALDSDPRAKLLKIVSPARILVAGGSVPRQAGPEIRIYGVQAR